MALLPHYHFHADWAGLTAVVVGNGLSILGVDFAPLLAHPHARVMVSNSGYVHCPSADVLMCSDRHWIKAHPDLSGYTGPLIIVTQPQAVLVADMRMVSAKREFIERTRGDIFRERDVLVEGHTSVSTNISAAVQRGASRILLLGLDLKTGPDGRRRSYDMSMDNGALSQVRYAKQIVHLTKQAAFVKARGIEVLNCSPRSGLECYPYAELARVPW